MVRFTALFSVPFQQADRFIRPTWARGTYERLQSLGAAVDFISVPNLQHEMNRQVPTMGLCGWP